MHTVSAHFYVDSVTKTVKLFKGVQCAAFVAVEQQQVIERDNSLEVKTYLPVRFMDSAAPNARFILGCALCR